jgi:membrane fusion protein (multidrug efflux system)
VNVLPRLGGVIETVHVKLGQPVTAGDPLITLEEGNYGWQAKTAQAQAGAARAGLGQAKVAVAAAQVEVGRARKLHARGAVTQAELDRAEAGLAGAQAAAKAGAAQLRVANTAAAMAADVLTWREVKSPLTGVVTRVDVEQGGMAGPTAPVLEVQDQRQLKLAIPLPARARARTDTGDKVSFTVDALPGRTFTATVDRMSPSLDPRSRKARVEAVVDPGQPGLLPHMRAEVAVTIDARDAVMSAPRQAILTTPLGSFVYVVRAGKAVAVPVEPGRADATHVPLGDAVAAGEAVIIAGQSLVDASGPVRVVSHAGATPASAEATP